MFRAGQILTAEAMSMLADPPRARVRRAANQSISGTGELAFDEVVYDDWGFFDAGAPTVLAPTVAGWYRVHGWLQWANVSDTTARVATLRRNGSAITGGRVIQPAVSTTTTLQQVDVDVLCGTSDTLSLLAEEAASGSVNAQGILTATWFAPWEA